MKNIIKNSIIVLLFFIIFIFKESIYGYYIKVNDKELIGKIICDLKSTYYENEYNKLLEEINMEKIYDFDYEYTKVLYRNIYNYYDEITILKGYNHDIKENMPIIDHNGLVGIVRKVKENSSIVKLITNKDSSISVKVSSSYGILQKEKNNLVIKSINNYENVNINDIVYTSGIGGLPGDILVGVVIDIKKDVANIEQKIYVKPYANLDNLSYLAVLKDNGEV